MSRSRQRERAPALTRTSSRTYYVRTRARISEGVRVSCASTAPFTNGGFARLVNRSLFHNVTATFVLVAITLLLEKALEQDFSSLYVRVDLFFIKMIVDVDRHFAVPWYFSVSRKLS